MCSGIRYQIDHMVHSRDPPSSFKGPSVATWTDNSRMHTDTNLHKPREIGNGCIHSSARLNEQEYLARLGQGLNKLLRLLVPLQWKVSLCLCSVDGWVHLSGGPIADGNGEAMTRHVESKVLPHHLVVTDVYIQEGMRQEIASREVKAQRPSQFWSFVLLFFYQVEL